MSSVYPDDHVIKTCNINKISSRAVSIRTEIAVDIRNRKHGVRYTYVHININLIIIATSLHIIYYDVQFIYTCNAETHMIVNATTVVGSIASSGNELYPFPRSGNKPNVSEIAKSE